MKGNLFIGLLVIAIVGVFFIIKKENIDESSEKLIITIEKSTTKRNIIKTEEMLKLLIEKENQQQEAEEFAQKSYEKEIKRRQAVRDTARKLRDEEDKKLREAYDASEIARENEERGLKIAREVALNLRTEKEKLLENEKEEIKKIVEDAKKDINFKFSKILYENNPLSLNNFGSAVTSNDKFLFVSAPFNAFDDKGIVYVYNIENLNLIQEISPEDLISQDNFGSKIQVFDNTLYITAKNKNTAGVVYVYDLINNSWELKQKLIPKNVESRVQFGNSISESKKYLAIGVPKKTINNMSNAGSVYLYKKNNNDEWKFEEEITNNEIKEYEGFGHKVIFYKNYLIISAIYKNNIGGIVIFSKNNKNKWQFHKEINENSLSLGSNYGDSIDYFDDHIIISAPYNNNNLGSIFLYNEKSFFDINSSNKSKIIKSPIGLVGGFFGKSIDIKDNFIYIGETNFLTENKKKGGVHFFIIKEEGVHFVKTIKNLQLKENDQFGYNINLNNNLLFITAYNGDKNNLKDVGSIYVYKK